jgi:hypothetical protein
MAVVALTLLSLSYKEMPKWRAITSFVLILLFVPILIWLHNDDAESEFESLPVTIMYLQGGLLLILLWPWFAKIVGMKHPGTGSRSQRK